MIKLQYQLGTATVLDTEYYRVKLEEVVRKCRMLGEPLDITGVRFVPATANLLMTLVSTTDVLVIDNENEVRNSRVEKTKEAMTAPAGVEPLPIMTEFDYKAYLDQFDTEVTYKYDYKKYPTADKELSLNCLILLMIIRPSIKVDITDSLDYVFPKIAKGIQGKRVKMMIDSTDEFHFYSSNNYFTEIVREKSTSSRFMFNGRMMSWADIQREYYIIPTYFGSQRIRENTPEGEVFKRVIADMKSSIALYFSNRDSKKKTLMDFIKERNNHV